MDCNLKSLLLYYKAEPITARKKVLQERIENQKRLAKFYDLRFTGLTFDNLNFEILVPQKTWRVFTSIYIRNTMLVDFRSRHWWVIIHRRARYIDPVSVDFNLLLFLATKSIRQECQCTLWH